MMSNICAIVGYLGIASRCTSSCAFELFYKLTNQEEWVAANKHKSYATCAIPVITVLICCGLDSEMAGGRQSYSHKCCNHKNVH